MTDPQIPVGLSNTPYYLRERKSWAIDQENYRHSQAMFTIGENAMFLLMWKVEDFLHGYVRRCPRCYDGNDATQGRASRAYEQPTKNRCPMCFGTTFEGGVRAKVIRPALFTDTDDQETPSERGVKHGQTVSVESTSDFRFRNGDYVLRVDGSRWQLAAPTRVTVRTGFGHPTQVYDAIGYSAGMASLEDPSSVSWMIPPNESDLKLMLSPVSSRYPVSQTDVVNGPLVPEGYTD